MSVPAVPEGDLLNPLSGELVRRTDARALASALVALRGHRSLVVEAARAFEDAIVEHSRVVGARTLHFDEVTFEVGADYEVEWDIDALGRLRDLGLPEERMDALVGQTVSYAVDARVARQVAAANEEYAAVIEAARRRRPARPRVSTKGKP